MINYFYTNLYQVWDKYVKFQQRVKMHSSLVNRTPLEFIENFETLTKQELVQH